MNIIPKKKKTSKLTIAKAKSIKQDNPKAWRTLYSIYNQKEVPLVSLETLAEKMLDIVIADKSIITLGSLLRTVGASPYSMPRFIKRCEKLRKAKEYALWVIGNNREEASLKKEIDFPTMKHMQSVYDPEWKAQELYFNNLKKDIAEKETSGRQIVIVKDYELDNKTSSDGKE